MDSVSTVCSEESNAASSVNAMASTFNRRAGEHKRALDEIAGLLDQEQHECEVQRIKYGNQWTLEPSLSKSQSMRKERNDLDDTLQQLTRQSQFQLTKLAGLSDFLNLCKQPLSSIASAFTALCEQTAGHPPQKRPSLIDDSIADVESAFKYEEDFISRTETDIKKLMDLRNARKSM
ncbi:hypothetical protein HDU91_002846, partial [Kappamyces sp. JEL0680]